MPESRVRPRGAGARLRQNSLTSTESLSKVQINLWHRAACSQDAPASLCSLPAPIPNLIIPGGTTTPGGVQGTTGRGTQCSGVADKDLIWEVFSNHKNSGFSNSLAQGGFSRGRLFHSYPTMDTQPLLVPSQASSTASPAFPGDLNSLHSHNINPSAAIPGRTRTLA